jgi:Lon protease-like protein
LPADARVEPSPDVAASVTGLRRTIEALEAQGDAPFLPPYRFDDAGWVANRWSELVPLPTATKLKLMTLQDPGARLTLVHGFLRRQQIITA